MTLIKENKDEGKVFIDEIVINGFVDEKFCPKCQTNKAYFDDYDSYFCPNCNVWLESQCSDPTCEFCSERPNKPLP